jgi:hypothetical protein
LKTNRIESIFDSLQDGTLTIKDGPNSPLYRGANNLFKLREAVDGVKVGVPEFDRDEHIF